MLQGQIMQSRSPKNDWDDNKESLLNFLNSLFEDVLHGRIAQFSLGGPGGFFKLIDHLTEEYAGAAERVLH